MGLPGPALSKAVSSTEETIQEPWNLDRGLFSYPFHVRMTRTHDGEAKRVYVSRFSMYVPMPIFFSLSLVSTTIALCLLPNLKGCLSRSSQNVVFTLGSFKASHIAISTQA